jgi:hypothetical protein
MIRLTLTFFFIFYIASNIKADNGTAKRCMFFESDDAYTLFSLALRIEVINDLHLDSNQIKKIKNINVTKTTDVNDIVIIIDNLKKTNLRKENPEKYKKELDKILIVLSDYKKNELFKILTKRQSERLKELVVQYMGPSIITIDNKIENQINLNKIQIENVTSTISIYNKAIDLLIKSHGRIQFSDRTPNETPESKQKKLSSLYESILILQFEKDSTILSFLSDDQIKVYKSIAGDSLSIDWGPAYLGNLEPGD